jgi:DnaJ family protein C protein 7
LSTTTSADFKLAIQHVSTDVRALKTELKKAEAALKRSKTTDYKILGVARDYSEAEVRKGYRRESLKHHPDKVHHSLPLPLCL